MSTALHGATLLVQLVVDGEPVPKARPRLAPRGHTYTPRKTVEHEAKVLSYLKASYPHLIPAAGALSVSMDFYLSTARRVDIDNLLKLPLDAMNRVVWNDDSQIVAAHACKYLSMFPRTEIQVHLLHGSRAA